MKYHKIQEFSSLNLLDFYLLVKIKNVSRIEGPASKDVGNELPGKKGCNANY